MKNRSLELFNVVGIFLKEVDIFRKYGMPIRMTALQKMAVRRIQKMATEMDIELFRHTPNKFGIAPTEKKFEEKDTISQNRWHDNTNLKREIVEWTSALLCDN